MHLDAKLVHGSEELLERDSGVALFLTTQQGLRGLQSFRQICERHIQRDACGPEGYAHLFHRVNLHAISAIKEQFHSIIAVQVRLSVLKEQNLTITKFFKLKPRNRAESLHNMKFGFEWTQKSQP